ncbi:MAG TPA: hypothetical protein PKD70_09925 [Saprospiraceae bacterium]|nr:hypothetical protein [Saprospiraceae bacterium]HMP14186.1 hypothetical protein [Saprospiraceae bacterium]
MSNRFVTIARFNFATEPVFILLKMRLEQEGILYYAAEENTVGIDPLLSITLGGIRVQVEQANVIRALAILKTITTDTATDEVWNPGELEDILDEGVQATDVHTETDSKRDRFLYHIIMTVISLAIVLFFLLSLLNQNN